MASIRTIFAIAVLCASVAAHAAEHDDFRAGVAAFEAGDYAIAAMHFEAAERAGRDDARLQFNLGSTYFKLGRLEAARARYARLLGDPQWSALAHYNLGLIEERRGDLASARTHYRTVLASTASDRLTQRASLRLAALVDDAQPPTSAWMGLVTIAGGHDDNVTLTEDPSIAGVSDQADEFVDVSAAASGYLSGGYASGLRLDLSAFGEFFAELDDFDIGTAAAGLTWTTLAGEWFVETGGKGEVNTLGSDVLTGVGTLGVRATYPLAEHLRLRLRGEGSWIDGASEFEYLGGWRARVATELQARDGARRWVVGYRFEYNDRDDYTSADEFMSYSPIRNSGYLRIEQRLGDRIVAEIRAEYLDSRYSDENRVANGNAGAIVEEARDDSRWTAGARVAWSALTSTSLFIDYGYADADSTFEDYRYTQNRVLLGLERSF